MAPGLVNWFLVLFLLLLLGSHHVTSHDENPRERSILLFGRSKNEAHHGHKGKKTEMNDHARGSSHMDHIEAFMTGLFTLEDLYVGKTMPIRFPDKNPSSSPHFLPREEADSIPFDSKELPNLLRLFDIPPGSPQAKTMEVTLEHCEHKPFEGETKVCATSLESMLDFVKHSFGSKADIKVLTTTRLVKSSAHLQNYTILEVAQVSARKIVPCHAMAYPYAVFYCHSMEGQSMTKAFRISLGAGEQDGTSRIVMKTVAVCHMDTSGWNIDHISFRLLGIKPGDSPVCHFFPADNLVWVSMALGTS